MHFTFGDLQSIIILHYQNLVCNFSFQFFFKPFPKQDILYSSKLKEFADDNFEFDENGRQFSKQIENTVGKGEIARYEQFILFPQCFQKTCIADT